MDIGIATLVSGIILIGALWGCDGKAFTPHVIKYAEHPYTLKDGTPCTIIRGGPYSGMVGITCNYSRGET